MKKNLYLIGLVITSLAVFLSCKEPMVGAPCKPETGEGTYDLDHKGGSFLYSIETRSVQCETGVCLTQVSRPFNDVLKHSFCSCRCKTEDEHTYSDDPDKYWDLCECPPNTICSEVLTGIKEIPTKVKGSYCIPDCIINGCLEPGQECRPPSDDKEPWNWGC